MKANYRVVGLNSRRVYGICRLASQAKRLRAKLAKESFIAEWYYAIEERVNRWVPYVG